MNCREFLTEFEERRALSQSATLHLNDCPGCRKTSSEQTRLWQMIEKMKRVDAPNDFDFRVKARIANGKPADIQPRVFFPALRYILPLGLIVLILSVVVFNTAYFSGGTLPAVADNISPTTDAVQIPANNSVSAQEIPAINNIAQSFTNEKVFVGNLEQEIKPEISETKEIRFAAVNSSRKMPVKFSNANLKEDENGGGSRDIAVRPPPPPLLPTEFSSNQSNENSPNRGNLMSADELNLSFIGIETASEGGAKKVKAVTSGSVAERAGVKVGDVIEAIDGRRISSKPAGTQSVQGKKLTVRRGAEQIEIDLQSKTN